MTKIKNKGQIQIGLGVLAAGGFLLASLTLAVGAYLKSGEATNRISTTEGDIKVINNRLGNIEKILEKWQEIQIKEGRLSKDGNIK